MLLYIKDSNIVILGGKSKVGNYLLNGVLKLNIIIGCPNSTKDKFKYNKT